MTKDQFNKELLIEFAEWLEYNGKNKTADESVTLFLKEKNIEETKKQANCINPADLSEDEIFYIKTAWWAVRKDYDYETLNYSAAMYKRENETDQVWEYVIECRDFGELAFQEKYAKVLAI